MKYSSEIPDYKKFDYIITDLNIFLISNCEGYLLNNSVDDHLSELQKLANEYSLTIPKWAQRYIDMPKGTTQKI